MSFAETLQSLVDDCGGGLAAALMGSDGIPIEQVSARPGAPTMPQDEIGAAGVEFGRILEEMRKASDALSGGGVVETVVTLARFTLVLRAVDAETFLVLALSPDGNLGKARYLIRRHLMAIRELL